MMIRYYTASIGVLVTLLLVMGHGQARAQSGRDGGAGKAKAPIDRRNDEPFLHAPERPAPAHVKGKAGIDRFEIDFDRITKSVRADGTVIVHLNGEGMEKMSLLDGDAGAPRAVCTSLLETELRRRPEVPADFRRLVAAGKAHSHADR